MDEIQNAQQYTNGQNMPWWTMLLGPILGNVGGNANQQQQPYYPPPQKQDNTALYVIGAIIILLIIGLIIYLMTRKSK